MDEAALTNTIAVDQADLLILIERIHADRFSSTEARATYLRLVTEVCKLPSGIPRSSPIGQSIEGSTGEFYWVARYDLSGQLIDVDVFWTRPLALRLVVS
jgi:hypothetical protein